MGQIHSRSLDPLVIIEREREGQRENSWDCYHLKEAGALKRIIGVTSGQCRQNRQQTVLQARKVTEEVETDMADWKLERADFRQKPNLGGRNQASWAGGPNRGRKGSEAN